VKPNITVDRLERALAICAFLVARDGPVMVPMFERLERELAAMRQTQDTVERAKRFRRLLSGSIVGESPQQVGHLACLPFPRFRFLVCPRPRPQDERAANEGKADDHQRAAKSAHVASPANTGTYFTPLKRIRRSKISANLFRKVENGRSLEAEGASEKHSAGACVPYRWNKERCSPANVNPSAARALAPSSPCPTLPEAAIGVGSSPSLVFKEGLHMIKIALAAAIAATALSAPLAVPANAAKGVQMAQGVDVQVGPDRDRYYRDDYYRERRDRDVTVGIGPGGVRVGPGERCRTVTTRVEGDDGRTVTRRERRCD
jgi:hypothetical protein